jgi:hypothetical protein
VRDLVNFVQQGRGGDAQSVATNAMSWPVGRPRCYWDVGEGAAASLKLGSARGADPQDAQAAPLLLPFLSHRLGHGERVRTFAKIE